MKTISYKLKILLLVMFIGLSFSCKKEHNSPKPQPSPFSASIEGAPATIPAAGGKIDILITAGTDGWWITSPQINWLTITRMYGSGDFKLPVTVKENTSGVARVISIKVNPTFNLPAVTFNITQDK
ncbi:BACON domain-containing protein [Pedobacter gandavensis]|uniref:BACON domain-containing protein n=1 Tax=Pedobacter gandavensis TaxID=2679963 RepID=UPI002931C8FE|nr:BACON domain-containing protein [Pedobacter gandavensis]